MKELSMEPETTPITAAGYQKIEQEIERLKSTKPTAIKRLAEAAALGDRSENAEYSESKRALGQLKGRIQFLTKQLQYSEVVTPRNDSKIEIGKTVTIQFLDDNEAETFEIVGKPEADVDANKISLVSPIGSALLGANVGDTVTVTAPAFSYQVKITDVTLS